MIALARVLAVVGAAGLLASVLTVTPSVGHPRPPAKPAAVQSPPNIVVVLTDDMRADELRFLPAVRRLQRSGVTFTRAVSADSLCCPARATLLTGKLAHNHLTIGNSPATHGGYQVFAENNDISNLLPQWLHDGGYRTAWIGKYLNGFATDGNVDQPDWNYFAAAVSPVYNYWRNAFAINGKIHHSPGYRERYTRQLLLQQIRAWAPGRRPFFVLYSTLAPHKAWSSAGARPPGDQRAHEDFDTSRLVVRPSVGETDLSDKPRWLQEYVENRGGPEPYPTSLEKHRVQALLSVNDTVGDLVATLRDQHELDRTVVIFTSDNGFMLREHDLIDKNKAYEESVHVPLVVTGPAFRGGTSVDPTVSLADVTATILRSAGIAGRHGGDGVPLQRVVADPASFERRPIEIEGSAAEYAGGGTIPTDPIGRFYTGAVWGPYSLVHYRTGDWEFYDRSVDPWQLANSYVAHPAPGSPQALLEDWYVHHVDCRGFACNDRIPQP